MIGHFIYFDTDHAIRTHDWIIENSGGLSGINNIGLLESALDLMENDDYYPNIATKLTYLVYSINKNHAFIDGNKRSSIALGAYFLEINGYDYCVKSFISKMENIAVWIASNTICRELSRKIITSILYDEDYSESLKLEIARAVSNTSY
ncbi:Fic family protein [Endozoicomonas sp.]|nr:Fic family protein [Endozoicomonas sp.]